MSFPGNFKRKLSIISRHIKLLILKVNIICYFYHNTLHYKLELKNQI